MTKKATFFIESTFLGPHFSLKMTKKSKKSTGKSPHFSRSTVHGPRPHFIDTQESADRSFSDRFGYQNYIPVFTRTVYSSIETARYDD